jgi:oligopeptide transport system permease protein
LTALSRIALQTASTGEFWRLAARRLGAQRGAMTALCVLGGIILACLLLPWLSPYDYYTPHLELLSRGPMLAGGHILGTDPLGRDLLVRVMWGCRISLGIGLAASLAD